MMLFNDEPLEFFEEDIVENIINQEKWNILIVDDEKIVHESTKMVLHDFKFENKKINFLCAYSALEAKKILNEVSDIAVVLLDVVMERDDSGLELVKYIRDELQNHFIRIVLRTGQPGQAPEEEVVINYDINDYKMKTELTLQKLLTTIVSALRSYRNLMALEFNRKGLEEVLKVENDLYEIHNMKVFAEVLLYRVQSMFPVGEDSFYMRSYFEEGKKCYYLIAGTGIYESYAGQNMPEEILQSLEVFFREVKKDGSKYKSDNAFIGYYKSIDVMENYVYFSGIDQLSKSEMNLFEILIANSTVAVDNISLNEKLIQTQSELINRLSEVIEARSEETASHVWRVSEIAALLGRHAGLDEESVQLLKLVAPLHDVGKIGIPERILNKPGKLNSEEFEIMKTHAIIGYRILKGSGLELLEAGALIAKEHHEYWNGKGYPLGLKGEEIHLFGRVTIIADVFDALSHDRVYKKAWPFEKVMSFMNEKSGEMFDPTLIDILIKHSDDIKILYDDCGKKIKK